MARADRAARHTRPPLAATIRRGPARPRSLWIAAGVLVLLAPTLAWSPQTGDGAEIVAVAIRGGVLHPPGFPLQAWLDRALVHVAGGQAALAISFLGLAAHAGACFFIAETMFLLGVGGIGRVMAAAAFALFPPVWNVAVQPEVFSLSNLLIAAIICLAVWMGRTAAGAPSRRAMAGLGLLGSLGAAQHPIALAALPALAAGVMSSLRPAPGRGARAAIFAAAFVLPAAVLYLSLPLLRTESTWPDWGVLQAPASVIRHALRSDYGTFSLSAATGPHMASGLRVWVEDVALHWNVVLLLGLVGLVDLVRRRELRPALLPIGGCAAAAFALLLRSRLPEQTYADEVLEHLQGPVTIAGSLLIGLGMGALRPDDAAAARRGMTIVLCIVVVAAWMILGWGAADQSHDRTLETYVQGLALALPEDAVYVTESDVETFWGVPTPHGLRFPISEPLLSSMEWYAVHSAPRLEPRVLGTDKTPADWRGFLDECLSRGLVVASSSRRLVETSAGSPELHGLLYLARPAGTTELTPATITEAMRLAPVADRLPVLPPRGHAFSRFYTRRFARAYAGSAEALRQLGELDLAARADSVADALNRGDPRERRSRLLRTFAEECRGRGF